MRRVQKLPHVNQEPASAASELSHECCLFCLYESRFKKGRKKKKERKKLTKNSKISVNISEGEKKEIL